MTFDGLHRCAMRGCIAEIIQDVAASGYSCTPWFVFFGSVIHRIPWVRDFLARWYVDVIDPFEYVDAFNITVPLEQTCEFVDAKLVPPLCDIFIRMSN